jgi:hypothetical protein
MMFDSGSEKMHRCLIAADASGAISSAPVCYNETRGRAARSKRMQRSAKSGQLNIKYVKDCERLDDRGISAQKSIKGE